MLQLVGVKTEPNDGIQATATAMDSSNTRKRGTADDPQGSESARERIAAVKKRILEHKHLRLKSVKEKHAEHVAEWFYLQSGGNLMDYHVWRKKPQTSELLNFMRTHRLEADDGQGQVNMVSGQRCCDPIISLFRVMILVF